jgi:hypothetical protein
MVGFLVGYWKKENNLFSSIIAVIAIALLSGFLFLLAGISGSLILEALTTDGIVRDFALWGVGIGAIGGTWGVWVTQKGKVDGKG